MGRKLITIALLIWQLTEFQPINSLIKISYTFLLLTPEYLRFRLIAIIRNDMVYVSQYNHLESSSIVLWVHFPSIMTTLSVNWMRSSVQNYGLQHPFCTTLLRIDSQVSSSPPSPFPPFPSYILLASFSIYGGKCAPFSVYLLV